MFGALPLMVFAQANIRSRETPSANMAHLRISFASFLSALTTASTETIFCIPQAYHTVIQLQAYFVIGPPQPA